MEHITLRIDTGNGAEFDELLRGKKGDGVRVLPDAGDLTIATKDGALHSGRAGAILSFTVEVGGVTFRAQTVTPVRLLLVALKVLQAAYTDDGVRKR